MEPEYDIGEWVVSKNHGAYNLDFQFNVSGYKLPEIIYYTTAETAI